MNRLTTTTLIIVTGLGCQLANAAPPQEAPSVLVQFADTGRDRIVAPLVPRNRMSATVGRLTPIVKVGGVDHVLLVPRMTAVCATDLRALRDRLTSHRGEIVAALDYLFLGL